MARWTASAKWAEGPALDGQRDMPLALSLSEGLGLSAVCRCKRAAFGQDLTLTSDVNSELCATVNTYKLAAAQDVDNYPCPA